MSNTTFTHKGVTITFDPSGEFNAVLEDGRRERAPSLEAMKKRIDKAKKAAFRPFFALACARAGDGLVRVKIVRRDEFTSKWERGGWIDEKGTTHQFNNALLPDTPEARAAWVAYTTAQVATEKADRARHDARDALPYIPYNYEPPKEGAL